MLGMIGCKTGWSLSAGKTCWAPEIKWYAYTVLEQNDDDDDDDVWSFKVKYDNNNYSQNS